eukprot:3936830-Alexandrium_andersonii.AAC.1
MTCTEPKVKHIWFIGSRAWPVSCSRVTLWPRSHKHHRSHFAVAIGFGAQHGAECPERELLGWTLRSLGAWGRQGGLTTDRA